MRNLKYILENAGRGPILVGFSIPVLILIVIAMVSYTSIIEFRSSARSVTQSHELQTKLQNLLTDLVSAESEARGYMIVGKSEYLSLHQTAAIDTIRDLGELDVVSGKGERRSELSELRAKIENRLDRLKITLEARQSAGLDGVVGVAGIGKRLMDEIREIAQRIESAENESLKTAGLHFEAVAGRTTLSILIGSMAAVLFQLASVLALKASFGKRQQLEAALLEISEREQHRIGQDLHDGICQQLTGVSLMVKSLQAVTSSSAARPLNNIVELINGCIEETRMVIRGLHPVSNDLGGLQVGLRELADSLVASAGIRCDLNIQGEPPILQPETATNLYRIVQESLRNAVKHSQCKTIQILMRNSPSLISITITDDGVGLGNQTNREGFGLGIMKYRATSIGAQLELTPHKPSGTSVKLTLKVGKNRLDP
jgi:signal transduction histidine kinase